MIRDATNEGLVGALGALVEDASAAFLESLDDSERATAHLYLLKAARAADEAWEQIVQEQRGPAVVGPTVADVERADPTPQEGEDDGLCTCWNVALERTSVSAV